MSPRSRKEYIETLYLRYRNASRNQKTLILDEFCATLGYRRKHVIRGFKKFRRFRKTKKQRSRPTPFYFQPSILKPLKKIRLAANLPCSKRLKSILPLWTQPISNPPALCLQRLYKPYPASPQPPSTASSVPPASTIKNEADRPPNPELSSATKSPSKPTSGMNPAPVSSKRIPSPTAGIP